MNMKNELSTAGKVLATYTLLTESYLENPELFLINSGGNWLSTPNTSHLISNFPFFYSAGESLMQGGIITSRSMKYLPPTVQLLLWRRAIKVCGMYFSGITFLALKDVTAVSWPTASQTDQNSVLAAWTVGFVASTEITCALGRHGGAAPSRGCVALGQDRPFRARGQLQGRACHPSTPQLLWKTKKTWLMLTL